MKKSLSLATHAKLLVLFPVACQLVFAIFLYHIVTDVQRDVQAASRARELITEGHAIARDTFEAVGEMRGAAPDGTLFDPEAPGVVVDDLRRRLPEFIRQAYQEPDLRPYLPALRKASDELFQLQAIGVRMKRRGENVTNIGASLQLVDALGDTGNRFLLAVGKILDKEEEKSSKLGESSRSFRGHMTLLFGSALAGSVLFTALMACLYAVRIRNPLAQIAENATRLSQRMQLLPSMKTDDEITRVDNVIHAVADSLQSAQKKDRAMVDKAADLICSLDENGVFTDANFFSRTMLGIAPSTLVGKALYELVVAEDSSLTEDYLQACRKAVESTTFDLRMQRGNADVVDTRWSAFWSKAQRCFFCVVTDITEQKNIERMKQDFVDMVSHDLRSPLTAMLGGMMLIAEGACGPVVTEVETEVRSASRNIDRLVGFVNDLLDFQKLSSGRMELELESWDVNEVIEEAFSLMRDFATSKNVQLNLTRPAITAVVCDAAKLRQAVVNFLSNAIKFTAENSVVSVEVDESTDFMTIRVTDAGRGVAREDQSRVFEAFEQLPQSASARAGTGLGLAICKLILEAHQGTVGVDSSPETRPGSTFWLRLPRSLKPESRAQAAISSWSA